MLTPEYLWSVADPVVEIWEELNKWALIDICERIVEADLYNFNALPGTARYRAWLLEQSGMHYDKMITVISSLTKKSEEEVKRLFEEAGLLALENDSQVYEQHGIIIPPLQSNQSLLRILNNAYVQTNGEMRNYTRTTLDSSNKQCINALDKSYVEVSSGMRSYSEVIKETVDDLAKTGTVVTYPTGHKDSIETAVRRAVLTGINQGTMKMTLECAIQNGYEYVLVDAHIGARVNDEDKIANHAGWQGKIYKIKGSDENYGNLEDETGFPNNPLGLGGYNCRHHIYPHILGDPNTWEKNIPDEEENKKAYELSQKQRYMERKIRETKRNLLGLETCIEHCPDDQTKFELQIEYDKKAAVLQRQNYKYNDFCKRNELRTENERIRAAKWNRENSSRSTSAARRYYTAKQSDNVMKSKFSKNLVDYNNGQKDLITHKNIEKELNKSEIGKQNIDFILNNPTEIKLCYNTDFINDDYGFYEPVYDEIYINVSLTKTVARTAEIIIHELTHKRFGIGGDLKSEVICIMQERMHRNRSIQLTYSEIRDIIKEVKELYPEFYGIWKKR